jgi:hypothetical protein
MHHKRREDMARKMAAAARYRSFVGATVLEIGADRHGVSAAMLAETGAARVISTNFRDDWPEGMDETIERRRLRGASPKASPKAASTSSSASRSWSISTGWTRSSLGRVTH